MNGIALGIWLAACPAAMQDGSNYRLTIDSSLQLKLPSQARPAALTAWTQLDYAIVPRDHGVEVLIRALHAKGASDGKGLFDREMSRAGVRFQTGSQEPLTLDYENAPPALQAVLREFDAAIVRLRLDGRGDEAAREALVDTSSTLLKNGIVDMALFFQAPFEEGSPTWESARSFSLGNGLVARGVLNYTRGGTNADGLVEVEVEGELKADSGSVGPGDLKNGVYRVKGVQRYDPTLRGWRSGSAEIAVTLGAEGGNEGGGASTGVIKLHVTRR